MKVLKFGGSSLGSYEQLANVISIVQKEYKKGDCAVVVSALYGITDTLIALANAAARGEEYAKGLKKIRQAHFVLLKKAISVKRQREVRAALWLLFDDLERRLRGIYLSRECSLRMLDEVMSYGERLSAKLLTFALQEQRLPAAFCDAREMMVTDANHGVANVDIKTTYQKVKRYLKGLHGKLPVITGYIASTPDGLTTTIGRNGTDYSAALVAAAIGSSQLQIWKDVDGVMHANPKKVKGARVLRTMSYEEAMEMSHFGSTVLHPNTMKPVIAARVPVAIKNTLNPDAEGTAISHKPIFENGPVRAISSVSNIALVNLQGAGMVGVPGVAGRMFSSLAEQKVNVVLISQASSEYSICCAVNEKDADRARVAIEREFSHEIENKSIRGVEVAPRCSIFAIIGDGMKGVPGVSGKLFSALGKHHVNVVAIAQGSSERNVSFVVRQSDEDRTFEAVHEEFFSTSRAAHCYIIGTGTIGSELVKQIVSQHDAIMLKRGIDFRISVIANEYGVRLNREGMALARMNDFIPKKGRGVNVEKLVKQIRAMRHAHGVFVDCTASNEIPGYYAELLEAGIAVVTPNKKGSAGLYQRYCDIHKASRRGGVSYLYETTVGAALPIIQTLKDMVVTGDEIVKIEGVFSGTLSYTFNSFSKGKKFSEIVREAHNRGYAEPDPRDDLSGMDVARKCLILAREIGMHMELSDVEVENLIPESCRRARSNDGFFKALQEFDVAFEKRRARAEKKGKILRYFGTIEKNKVTAGLYEVSLDHPCSSLSGSDNMAVFTTRRYRETPLVIRGPGAGKEVTAGGVFADVLKAVMRPSGDSPRFYTHCT